jgi:hypothetical protein
MELRLLLARLAGLEDETKPELEIDLTPDTGEPTAPVRPREEDRFEAVVDESAPFRTRFQSSLGRRSPTLAIVM